jgi:PEP-CTERM motif-containing protein
MNTSLASRALKALLVASCFIAATLGFGQSLPTISVFAASAPNVYGSPNYALWEANATYALEHGLSSYGASGTPSFYSQISGPLAFSDNYVTSFNSWRGSVNPSADFGSAFAGEYGNRVQFGLVIDGQGSEFSIAQLSFSMNSSDPGNTLSGSYALGSFAYNASYIGVEKGADGLLWTSDDVYITSGANTQLVDGLISRGPGNAWWPATPSEIADFNDYFAGIGEVDFTGSFALDLGQITVTGADTVQFGTSAVPEPSTYGLFAALTALLGVWFRRRSRQA